MYDENKKELDVIVPIALDLDWPTYESVVDDILYLNKEYGFKSFALACPGAGWRSKNYPSIEVFENLAKLFRRIKDTLTPYGIECGWWMTVTLKGGPSDKFSRVVKPDGSETVISSCPLDPNFIEYFSDCIYSFSKIAEPAFILTEDDYSVVAASYNKYGCFCDYHLKEFEKITGKAYSRKDLYDLFESHNPEGASLFKKWGELMKESLIRPIKAAREKLDKILPDVPIGYCESGACDKEGECTEELSIAMAGKNNIPFSRIHGAFYGGGDTKDIPKAMFTGIYFKQHVKSKFNSYYEFDTFPHTRFFNSARQMGVFMSTAYSHGYIGGLFQVQQLLDNPNEELVYAKLYTKERARFNALHIAVQDCIQKGVEVFYDPFYNNYDETVMSGRCPLWVKTATMFGIPFVTTKSDVAFWDIRQAKYADHETVMEYLSKGLILDGDAAKELVRRGYGEYIGVDLGENVIDGNNLFYDLGAREIIKDGFIPESKGRNMPPAHMYAPSNGVLYKMTPTDEKCEVISELYDFQKNFISVAMTRFENSLGGRIVVMGETINNNLSQSLYNYRRQKLIQNLITWCSDTNVYVKDAPAVYVIHNETKNPSEKGFSHLLTLTNLCEDEINSINVYLPPYMRDLKEFAYLDIDGVFKEINLRKTEYGIEIPYTLNYCESLYLRCK